MTVHRHFFSVFLRSIFLFSAFTAPVQIANGYPILLTGEQLESITGSSRENLIAIKSDGTNAQQVPLQIDEVEDNAALVLRNPYEVRKLREGLPHPKKADPFRGRLYSVHRIVIDDKDFATCAADCQKKIHAQIKTICASSTAINFLKITLLESQKNLFIGDCGIPVKELPARNIKFDAKTKSISTDRYEYIYTSDKNIFFKEINLKPSKTPLLSKSELKAYLKPKYLFNMKFKDDDVVSQITSLSRGTQSLSLEVALALNILAMKINTQICCDVSFYEDSLYFPVVLDLPFAGSSFAKGSGLFFGFQTNTEGNVKTEMIPSQSPGASDAILIQQDKNLLALGFRSPTTKDAPRVKPTIVSPAELTAMKFLPVQSSSGIFYDVQNAKEGFQHFMVWMLIGQESERAKLIEYAQQGARINVERFTNLDAH